MPRIAVAVVVFALIAFSIGFNTARYSVVWEMVGGPPQLSQSPQPAAAAESETATESAAAWDSADAEPSPYRWERGNFNQDASDEYGSQNLAAAEAEEEQPGYEDSFGYSARQAEDEEPSQEYSVGVDLAGVDLAGVDLARDDDSADAIRRLPPIDQVAPFRADRYAPHSPAEPVAGYPSSGT